MAGNTQMPEAERGQVGLLHGIAGMLVATVLLLSILAGLTVWGFAVQKANATNYYTINQDLNAIKAGSAFSDADEKDGSKNYTMWKNQE
jgi:hypothetical protein